MSEFIIKNSFFTSKQIFFEEVSKINNSRKVDTLLILGHPYPVTTFHNVKTKCTKQITLLSDICEEDQKLWESISKTVRNEIRRAAREGVSCKIYDSHNINEELIKHFNELYHGMYAEKGKEDAYLPMNAINSFIENNAFIISVAEVDGEIAVCHSYVVDHNNARLLHSCSEFRNVDSNKRNAIGRANKYLHWKDIQYLKKCGIKVYDWGGITSYDTPNGIDRFKIAFGGRCKEYYNILCYQTLRSQVGHALLNIIKKIR